MSETSSVRPVWLSVQTRRVAAGDAVDPEPALRRARRGGGEAGRVGLHPDRRRPGLPGVGCRRGVGGRRPREHGVGRRRPAGRPGRPGRTSCPGAAASRAPNWSSVPGTATAGRAVVDAVVEGRRGADLGDAADPRAPGDDHARAVPAASTPDGDVRLRVGLDAGDEPGSATLTSSGTGAEQLQFAVASGQQVVVATVLRAVPVGDDRAAAGQHGHRRLEAVVATSCGGCQFAPSSFDQAIQISFAARGARCSPWWRSGVRS